MQCNAFTLWCCSLPECSVQFQHSQVEFAGNQAFFYAFCLTEGTVILDSDYLFLTQENSINRANGHKFGIKREVGNTSGTGKIKFPWASRAYNLFYVRESPAGIKQLGKMRISIEVPYEITAQSNSGRLYSVQEASMSSESSRRGRF